MLAKVLLQNTDLRVSALSYGTNKLGWALDQGQSEEILDTFLGHGGNFLDTAASYGDWIPDVPRGVSESTIGKWLAKQNRADIVIGTKGGMVDARANDGRNRANPKDVTTDLLDSLERLMIDTIDFYWMHADDPSVPVAEIIDMLNEHREKGRIRFYGASNWTPARIREANAYAKKAGKPGFAASETFWGLALPNLDVANRHGYVLHYESDPDYAALHREGLPFLGYSAQSDGYFSKVADGIDPMQIAQGRYANPANKKRLAAVVRIAERRSASINDIVLAYLLSQPLQTIPIFGTTSTDQMRASVNAARIHLGADELAELRG